MRPTLASEIHRYDGAARHSADWSRDAPVAVCRRNATRASRPHTISGLIASLLPLAALLVTCPFISPASE